MRTILRSGALKFQDDTSNKGYISQVIKVDDKYMVTNAWGGLGKAFQTSTTNHDTEERAFANSEKVLTEKLRKGYKQCSAKELGFEEAEAFQHLPSVLVKDVEWQPMLLSPITEKEAFMLLDNDDWVIQRKLDGVRLCLECDENGPRGYNRKGQRIPLPLAIGDAASAMYAKVGNFKLDGELVGNNSYWAFDSISSDVCTLPMKKRFQHLTSMLEPALTGSAILLTPTQFDNKNVMWEQAMDEQWEGVVLKRADKPYTAGRGKENLKCKFWHDISVFITGINVGTRREDGSLEMSCFKDNELFKIGNVSSGVKEDDFSKVRIALKNNMLLVADIKYLYYEFSPIQPQFLKFRSDLTNDDLIGQKVFYKNGTQGTI